MGVGGGGDCVTLCYITQCAWPSLSLYLGWRDTQQSEEAGEDGGFKGVLVLMRAI